MLESIAPKPEPKDFARIPKDTLLGLLGVAGYQVVVVIMQHGKVEGVGPQLDIGLAVAMVALALLGYKKPTLAVTLGLLAYCAVWVAHAFNSFFDLQYTRFFVGMGLFALWRHVRLYRHLKIGAEALGRSSKNKH